MNKETRSLVSQDHSLEPVLVPGTLVMLQRGPCRWKGQEVEMFDCLIPWSSILPKIRKQMVWVSTEEEAQLRKRFICIYT